MANVCCPACFSPANENGTVGQEIMDLRVMIENLSPSRLNDLISHIEDGLNDIVIANPQRNVSGAGVDRLDIVKSFTEFGRALVQYVLRNTRACKVCFLQNLGWEARKVVSDVLEEEHPIRWVAGGLSVVAYMMDEMKEDSSKRSVYVQPILYMLGLLKYIRQQNAMELQQKMLKDVVNFIVMGSLLCIKRMQSRNLLGLLGFPACVNKTEMDNLQFRLVYTYPDLAPGEILGKFPISQYMNADAVNVEKARDEVIQLLVGDRDYRSRRAVVIYGQEGIGKTTIANAVFNRVQMRLRGYEFSRVEINYKCSEHDIKILQQQLLQELFGKIILLRSSVEGRAALSNALREARSPVFIFIDNVQRYSVLENLLPMKLEGFPIHSRILITSSNPPRTRISAHFEEISYRTQRLEAVEAKNILCKEVLGRAEATFSPKVDINSLTRMCDGIPLALRMVASYLRQNGNHVSACKHLLEYIEISSTPGVDICCSIVDFIYNRLEEPYREAFLDIAIFFNNWERQKVVYAFPDIQLQLLEKAGLIMISSQGRLFVHDVVRERATTLSKNTRITDEQYLDSIVQADDRSALSKIKGIWLSEGLSEFQLEAGHLDSMHKSLRVLYLGKSIKVSGECKFTFEEVRFFHICNKHYLPMDLHNFKRAGFFHGSLKKEIDFLDLTQSLHLLESSGVSDLTKLPVGLQLANSLHVVELIDSPDLDKLPEGFNFFSSLEELDLSNCVKLRELPGGLGRFKSLCRLKLTGCSELETLPEKLGDLSSLEEMDCTGCVKLMGLPASFGQLQSLCYLQLSGCSQLILLPESFGNLYSLEELDLSYCKKLEKLPDRFPELNSLSRLQLQGCSELKALPQNFGKLFALEELDLSSDDKLESLVGSGFGQLERLRRVQLQGCSNLISLDENIDNLSFLEELDLTGCANLGSLPNNFDKLKSLRVLKLCCTNLKELPQAMGDMSSLQWLTLTNCDKIAKLPTKLSQLKSLNRMHLASCSEITEIPLPSLEELEMTDCSKLMELPDNIEQHQHSLRVLKLHGCSTLSGLPRMFGKLPSLEDLVLTDCKSLRALPHSFNQLKSVRHLRLRGASKLATDSVAAFPTSLETLDLSDCSSLQNLPQGFGQHTHLILLFMDGCSKLSALPDGFGGLNSLRYLSIAGCTELQKLSADFGNLTSLEAMNASRCSVLQGPEMDKLDGMEQLRLVDIRESPRLIQRWNEIQETPLLVMSHTEPEKMYADAILKTCRRGSIQPFAKALVWLTMIDPELDEQTSEVESKVTELTSKHSSILIKVDVRHSNDVPQCMENMVTFQGQLSTKLLQEVVELPVEELKLLPEDIVVLNRKVCQTLIDALFGWWKLQDPRLFTTLATLHTFLVMIDMDMLAKERKLHMEAILPAFQNGGYQDVDFQHWIDPKGGFIRIFSPFVSLP